MLESLLISDRRLISDGLMSLTVRARVGKKRMLVIPKRVAELLGLSEGSMVKITAFKDRMIIEPIRDAIWLSIHGEKVARITLEELEGESIERQKKYGE